MPFSSSSILRIIPFILLCFFSSVSSSPTLRHVQLFFRHGQRTPTTFLAFPSEDGSSKPKTKLSFEVGEMTNKGMWQEYVLGQKLRSLYGELFGDKYCSREILVLSGRDNRTAASAELALAGLFPPKGDQIWNRDLLWLPIPVETLHILDHVSFGLFDDCPKESERVENSDQFARMKDTFGPITKELSTKTGLDIPDLQILQKVTDAIVTRAILSDILPLPGWASSAAFLERIRRTRLNLHEQLIDIFLDGMGGWHFDQIVGRMDDVVANRTRQKSVLYSAHDTNILTMARFLDIAPINDSFLDYAAFVAFELYQDGADEYFVEIKFHPDLDGTTLSPLALPDCPRPCPFHRFRSLRSRITSPQWMAICTGAGSPQNDCAFYGSVAGVLTVLVVLLLGFLFSLLLSCWRYKRSYEKMVEEEQEPLMGRKRYQMANGTS